MIETAYVASNLELSRDYADEMRYSSKNMDTRNCTHSGRSVHTQDRLSTSSVRIRCRIRVVFGEQIARYCGEVHM